MQQEDAIEINGKKYLPSGRAAKLVGYTKDYVGQLARGGKLDAKLVGRGWYITEDSIRAHKLGVHYELTKPKKKRTQEAPMSPRNLNEDDNSLKYKDILHDAKTRDDDNLADTTRECSDEGVSEDTHESPEHVEDVQDPIQTPPVSDIAVRYKTTNARNELMRARIEFEQMKPLAYHDAFERGKKNEETAIHLTPRARNTANIDIRTHARNTYPRHADIRSADAYRTASEGVVTQKSGHGSVSGYESQVTNGAKKSPKFRLGVWLLVFISIAFVFFLIYLVSIFFF